MNKAEATRYFAARALGHISAMRLNKGTGLFPKFEGWRNVVEHELVEAEVVDVLGEKLGLSTQERRRLRQAALLHDVFKKDSIRAGQEKGPDGFEESAMHQSEFLKSRGVPEDVIELTESVAHASTHRFTGNLDDAPLPQQIIYYADTITSGSQIVSLEERIGKLNRDPRYHEVNERGRAVFDGATYFDVMLEVGKRIEEGFARTLGLPSGSHVPEFIRACIADRITKGGE